MVGTVQQTSHTELQLLGSEKTTLLTDVKKLQTSKYGHPTSFFNRNTPDCNRLLSDEDDVLESNKPCAELCNLWAEKKSTCILRVYLSLSCCWQHCGLHFKDPFEEQFFLHKNYFRSSTHIAFSSVFAVLQLLACAFYFVVIFFVQPNAGSYINNWPMMIGSGVDGALILGTHFIQVCWMSRGRRRRPCVQCWHTARMTIGCIAVIAFYLGAFFTTVDDIYRYNMTFAPNQTIGGAVMNVTYTCGKLWRVNPGRLNDWICAFFAQNWQFSDFIFISAGPQTLFLHALPARLSLPVLIIELIATFLIFFFPSLRRGNTFFPAYLGFYQTVFALGLALVVITAERESRRNFKAQATWRKLRANLLYKLSQSQNLDTAMKKYCPQELKCIRQVGYGDGLVPLHKATISISENMLYSGYLDRKMCEDLENYRIPPEEIEQFENEKLGRGGQANVYKGRWKHQLIRTDVAIKKWGYDDKKQKSGRDVKKELAKYKNEVDVLIQLKKHR